MQRQQGSNACWTNSTKKTPILKLVPIISNITIRVKRIQFIIIKYASLTKGNIERFISFPFGLVLKPEYLRDNDHNAIYNPK